MNKLNFIDRNDGEVLITGCDNCPFVGWGEGYYYCRLDESLNIEVNRSPVLMKISPMLCKLRKPNFSLKRYMLNG